MTGMPCQSWTYGSTVTMGFGKRLKESAAGRKTFKVTSWNLLTYPFLLNSWLGEMKPPNVHSALVGVLFNRETAPAKPFMLWTFHHFLLYRLYFRPMNFNRLGDSMSLSLR